LFLLEKTNSFIEAFMIRDSYRILWLTIIVLFILFLGIYSHSVGTVNDEKFQQILLGCLSATKECPQQSVVLSAQIKSIGEGYFIASIRTRKTRRWKDPFDRKHDLKVLVKEYQLSVGDIIALKGKFFSPQIFILEEYETEGTWVREAKYGISLLALGLTGLIWLRTFRFSVRNFMFFRKEGS
jgi:hypothetical protein